MSYVEVRAMTESEYEAWSADANARYAQAHLQAGTWTADEALANAQRENQRLLPRGVHTPRMLLLTGVDATAGPIGSAWVGLDHPRGVADTAFVYDIEIAEQNRGQGYGRALLTAVEEAARTAGARTRAERVRRQPGRPAAVRLEWLPGHQPVDGQRPGPVGLMPHDLRGPAPRRRARRNPPVPRSLRSSAQPAAEARGAGRARVRWRRLHLTGAGPTTRARAAHPPRTASDRDAGRPSSSSNGRGED